MTGKFEIGWKALPGVEEAALIQGLREWQRGSSRFGGANTVAKTKGGMKEDIGHRRRAVQEVLDLIQEYLKTEAFKPSLGDYVRLLQLEQELSGGDDERELIVTWVTASEKQSVTAV